MYNSDTEMLFPSRVIPTLRDLRGESWQTLVDRVSELDEGDPEHQAFVLLMIRLGNCTSCHADSYRAMRGCTPCAEQTIRRFRGTDSELNKRFEKARGEMETFLLAEPEVHVPA